MTFKSWTSRLAAPLIAWILTVAPLGSPVHAVESARKVSVVSFGLFGDQGVFRREATGAARVATAVGTDEERRRRRHSGDRRRLRRHEGAPSVVCRGSVRLEG